MREKVAIPREEFFPSASENELLHGLSGQVGDPEISMRGILARLVLVETKVQNLDSRIKSKKENINS